jgi:hypothetical protein
MTKDLDKKMAHAASSFAEAVNRDVPRTLDYSEASLARLDAVIDEAWPGGGDEDTLRYTLPVMAAYVGEVLRRNLGGLWVLDGSRIPAIEINGQRAVPYNRAGKRLTLGSEWSLALFYGELAEVCRDGQTPSSRGWRRRR